MVTNALDHSKLKQAIQTGIPLSITTYTFPHEMEIYMAEILRSFLKEIDEEFMAEYLIYCMNELVTNAKKANTKRVYFREKCLDINNPDNYEQGMKTFKKDTLNNIQYWLSLQKQAGYYIKTILQVKNGKIKIEIRNNAALTKFEFMRIHDKIARSRKYDSVDDAFSQILDDTEGAGLGIIIMVLMLKKIGVSDDNYTILSENGETISRIILPLNKQKQETISEISRELVVLIDQLPHFPDNILHIINLLNNPKSKFSEIATYVSRDVSLTSDLLKITNSAAFSLANPCTSIYSAVKLVGIRGLQNMLLSVGAMKSLGSSTKEQKVLWDHSSQVAFYSYNIARNFFPSEHKIIDDSYVCGLLHDIGRVIFESAHPALLDNFKKCCKDKALSTELFEKLASGVNHAQIGAEIAKKWNFPPSIIASIRYHHEPKEAPNEYKKLVGIIYLSNLIWHYQEGLVEFYQFDITMLRLINITNKLQLDALSLKLDKAYKQSVK
ncbi:MAG: hypothetical protein BKP49_06395 [Treponema sp. CETP13]|nr:MAG: hypothetical protein BKP49_06395 [Treponema sp. CETP13]